jgi:hypothetical protein
MSSAGAPRSHHALRLGAKWRPESKTNARVGLAARIMIELRNKHTASYAAFRSYFARSSAAISLAKA